MRTEDILQWARFLRGFQAPGSRRSVHLVAQGAAAISALHRAALNPDAFYTVTLRNMVRSWEDMVSTPEPVQAADVVHGALRHYTLADLIELAGREKTALAEPVDGSGRVAAIGPR
ncbi:MAG: hypothetical protein HY735_05485 [Verrucomicrobia bacterium]|nr:hypothetical protein [Verrucomicrobiota bacterium]